MGGVCRRGVLADLLTRSLNAVDELRCLRSRLALLSPWLSLGAKVIADLLLSCSPCLRVLAGCQCCFGARMWESVWARPSFGDHVFVETINVCDFRERLGFSSP